MKMRIAVCDGSFEDRQCIEGMIEKYSRRMEQKLDIADYISVEDLCNDIDQLRQCHIIFLDIDRKQDEGLAMAKQIKDLCPEIDIVLVTASLNYVLEGYKVKATRFLLKKDLEHTIDECLDEILGKQGQKQKRLAFAFVEGEIELELQKIIYVETDRHKNVFHTMDASYGLYKKLNEIEEQLRDYGFLRVHQSYLVNMRYVEKISSYVLKLSTGQELSVPKSRYQKVKREFAVYQSAEQRDISG
ncbi:MAG: LytTR family DNA-binding domain-containing protein [Lachnospiraceae bacterium]|nr:LytTR family DNA-binding domain-containing protein [Lachnospiraceae bacterium]